MQFFESFEKVSIFFEILKALKELSIVLKAYLF